MIGIIILGFLGLITIGGILFVNLSPEFGGKHRKEDIRRYETSGHFKDGIFHNITPTNMHMSPKDIAKITFKYLFEKNEKVPNTEPPIEKVDSLTIANTNEDFSFVWFGHSTFYIKMGNKNILLDPMFSEVPAPHPSLGNKRFQKELPIDLEKLPEIDYVFISHDHYDHLDYKSIKKLRKKVKHFFVPLGVGAHLRKWGVEESQFHELNWWDEFETDNLKFVFTPSRHFSGRGPANRFSTLWGSWVIQSQNKKIYFSGDGGYDAHFSDIGDKYGPFDLAFIECGQYNKLWSEIHMMPEETAIAARDLKAKVFMPIHWGAFTLAMHAWNEPIKRVIIKANELDLKLIAPMIGDFVNLNDSIPEVSPWWNI